MSSLSTMCTSNPGKKLDSEYDPEPEDWRQLPVNVCIAIRGVYLQKTCAGLLIDVTHLQYAPRKRFSPF